MDNNTSLSTAVPRMQSVLPLAQLKLFRPQGVAETQISKCYFFLNLQYTILSIFPLPPPSLATSRLSHLTIGNIVGCWCKWVVRTHHNVGNDVGVQYSTKQNDIKLRDNIGATGKHGNAGMETGTGTGRDAQIGSQYY